MCLGALGVVYGDIGTSPLYALRECFHGPYAVLPTPANVFGVLSLIVWTLIVVISIKYLMIVLRADNRGEGGILALMALIRPQETAMGAGSTARNETARETGASAPLFGTRSPLVLLALFGAALLYGDGMITPAISVLSAIEGLHVATPLFDPYVLPITVLILFGLFAVQSKGTAKVGAVFGPVTLVWFTVLGVLGATAIVAEPKVLGAVNPLHAVEFFMHNPQRSFLVLGAVFLVTTGGEALYADMGHFGRLPIRLTWYAVVLPGLALNYFGQGALLLADPHAAHNPFYRLAPDWALYPLVALAAMATVIASQAVISGCFSLTRQAVQLGYSPRLKIDHTSEEEIGQIFIWPVNWALMLASVGLVVFFGSSGNLAAAYGVAVSTTMVVTTVLLYVVARDLWGWSRTGALLVTGSLGIIDLAFFGANIAKILHGGWFALAVAAFVFVLMTTWRRGRRILLRKLEQGTVNVDVFLKEIARSDPHRVSGTAVFMTANPDGIPSALLHNFKHNKVLHQRVRLLTVWTREIPRVPRQERMTVTDLGHGFHRIIAYYGFMESPSMREILSRSRAHGLESNLMETSFFLGVETLVRAKSTSRKPEMPKWQERLFALMTRNAQRPTDFYQIPPNRVVELGAQIEL
ncbi:potassium uptake protein [Candidatus Binatia bacterium]|nr:potassium uptake protein [Candidatus Binatia bacterium]